MSTTACRTDEELDGPGPRLRAVIHASARCHDQHRRQRAAPSQPVIHPLWVRITHWINALAMLVMIGSGWQIYNASPLFAFTLPALDHARRLARRRAALAFRGDVAAGRQRPRLCRARASPPAASAASCCRSARARSIADAKAALTGQARARRSRRSTTPCRSCSMLGVILAGVVIVLSGLAIWKPVQLQELTALFGGYDAARYVHFFAMAAIVGFLVVHVLHGAAGAEEPARHGHAADEERRACRASASIIPGVDPKLLIKDAGEAPARSVAAAVPARRRQPRRADLAHRLRHRRRRRRREACCARFRDSTTGRRRWLFNPNRSRRPIPRARSPGRSRSTPTTRRTKRPRSTATTTSSRSAAWSTTRSRGRSTSSTRCRRKRRSPATSASRAGARSANGPACASRDFLKRVGADTRAKYVWFQLRRGLFQHHRHADRAASADADDASSSTTRSCRASTASR